MAKKLSDELTSLPGVGLSIAADLRELGINQTSDLIGKDPEKLYKDFCDLKGMPIDRCVLYTFRCAVYVASEKNPKSELMQWWKWKDTALQP